MKPFTYSMKLRLRTDKAFFGPGVVEVLRQVERTGSLQTAAESMGMSYSKAWRIVKTAEEEIGFPIMERKAGGSGGGFSRLTERGREFLDAFEGFEGETARAAEELFQKYFHQPGKNG